MKTKVTILLFTLVALVSASSTFAHHGSAAYDESKPISLTGTVTEFFFINPHALISIDVKNDKGGMDHWSVEFGGPRALLKQGWTRDTLKPGDSVTVTVFQARNGTKVGLMRGIKYSDGKDLPLHPPPPDE